MKFAHRELPGQQKRATRIEPPAEPCLRKLAYRRRRSRISPPTPNSPSVNGSGTSQFTLPP
jgi:hypothetical protein